jgi:dTDP-4-dehydrorhamnose 3,5-epimerase
MHKNVLMQSKILDGVWISHTEINHDRRGTTYEWFNSKVRPKSFEDIEITQLLTSVSKKNVIRGLHFSTRNNPQFKIIKCTDGKILDIVIDLRIESATFGKFDIFELNSGTADTIMISEGFGHGYQVLSDRAIVEYALQTNFKFEEEHVINPYDPKLKLPWKGKHHILSDRDRSAENFDTFFNSNNNS